jgi:polynucleotide 5'-kinase involved in rRNA processing
VFDGTVLVCGGKNTGKSTLLRCLANATLSAKNASPTLFLDCDPGQCEFSVSGSVSLVEVTNPLIGPAFTHCSKPARWVRMSETVSWLLWFGVLRFCLSERVCSLFFRSYFLGHTNIVSCPDEYLQAVTKLVELKNSTPEYKKSPLFVNTMGWTRGKEHSQSHHNLTKIRGNACSHCSDLWLWTSTSDFACSLV